MHKLSSFTPSKDNNFNLIRMLAATAVLVSHSYALSLGLGFADPINSLVGVTLGTLAVDVFFIASGFLVGASILNRNSAKSFIQARALRIFPALIIVTLITVLLVGPLITQIPSRDYFLSKQTLSFLVHNMTLVHGVRLELPGVFTSNPFPNNVNGSLWTLPYEISMYGILLLLWATPRLAPTRQIFSLKLLIPCLLLILGTLLVQSKYQPTVGILGDKDFLRLGFSFFSGTAYYLFRQSIPLSPKLFYPFAAILLLSIFDSAIFSITFALVAPYIILYLAYIPSGVIRKYNRLGDYSYGIYIYAFLWQQVLCFAMPGISVGILLISSFVVSLISSILSWHFIESPALQLKSVRWFSRSATS